MGCTPCGTKFSIPQVQSLLRSVGFPDVRVNTNYGNVPLIAIMSAICMGESCNGCSAAINPGFGANGRPTNEYSVGLFQINTKVHKTYSVEQLKNPTTNATEALRIYRLQGLRAWGSYTDFRYKPYMPQALAAYSGGASSPVPTPTATTLPAPQVTTNADGDNAAILGVAVAISFLILLLRR